jgi:predicted DNA binding CopG/RHH family protein
MKTDFVEVLKNADKWDDRELGASMEHAEIVPNSFSAEVDEQLSLQAISIRLPKSLLRDLKDIASRYEIGYQPMVRDLLSRFALAEQKKYLNERLARINELEGGQDDTVPVSEFLSDVKKKA